MRPAVVRRSRLLPAALALVAAIAIGCSNESSIGPAKVASVRITPDTVRMVAGAIDTVKAFPIDVEGAFLANKTVRWSSSNEAVATVTNAGEVMAVALGDADLTATVDNVSSSVRVLVSPAPTIGVDSDSLDLAVIAQSGGADTGHVNITNVGGGLLTDIVVGTVAYEGAATGWVSAELDQGVAPADMRIIVTPGALTVGTYVATVPITSDASTNSPLGIKVVMTLGADVATAVATLEGDNQTGSAGTATAIAPAVLVTDQFDNPVAGQAVTYAIVTGGGSLTGASAVSGIDGIARVGSWTLGPAVGGNSITATATGLTGSPITFIASAGAAAASQIAINGGNGQTVVAGQPVPVAPSALVRDPFGNPVGGVQVTFAIASGGGQITGGTQTTNASGIATIGSWTTGTTAGANSLSITSNGLTGSPLAVTATGTPGTATTVAISAGNNQSVAAGNNVAIAPAARVTDANGNGVPGITVTFQVTAGGGSIAGATPATNASGIATITSWTLGASVGANSLSATAPGLTGSPLTFNATGVTGVASTIAVDAGNNQAASAGGQVSTPPSVLVTDAFGNPVAGVGVTFAVASGGGSITGGAQSTNASGIATVGSWTLGGSAGVNTLNATSTGLTGSPITFTATGNPGNATNIALVQGDGQSGTVGGALATTLQVLVTDNLANPIPGVTVGWATASGSLTPASSVTNGSGIATTTWTLGTSPGAVTATGSVGGLTGSPVLFSATASAGAPANIAIVAGNGQSATVNTAVATAPSVRISDAFNNPLSNVAVTFAVTTGGGSGTGLNQLTNGSGIATMTSWTLGTTAGGNTLSATATGPGSIGFSATGTAGAATQIAISAGNAQSATVNTTVATAPRVLVRDAFNNPVANVSVNFGVTGGGGSATGGAQTTNASGLAQVTSWTLGTTAGANSLSATSAGLTGSPLGFSATGVAGAVTTIVAANSPPSSATVGTAMSPSPSVLARDQYNNPVSGAAITFTRGGTSIVNCGAGSTTSCNVNTNASGIATITAWTMSTTAGTNNNTLSVTRAGATGTSFTASGNPGAVNFFSVTGGTGQTVRPGQVAGAVVSVIARDVYSNAVPGVSVTFTVSAGGGATFCGFFYTTSCSFTTNASGAASSSSWRFGNGGASTNGTYSNVMTVSASGASSVDVSGTGRWSYANDVFPRFTTYGCSGCHAGSTAGNYFLNFTSAATAYSTMRGVTAMYGCTSFQRVNTAFNSASSSALYYRLVGTGCGTWMAPGNEMALADANIIRDWINNASPNN